MNFNLPKLNTLYQLEEDIYHSTNKYNYDNGKYENVREVISAGSIFKIIVIHYSAYQDYCNIQFSRKYNKDTPLKEPVKFSVTIDNLCKIKAVELNAV